MLTASSLAWKTFSESQDAVALQQIKERGALPMIDRGDIRQAIDRCSNIWLHCRALVMVSSSIRLTAWLQNSKKRAERSERLMYEQSHRDYLRSGLSASSSACHGLLIITVITPLPTKPSATKMPENRSWRTRQLLTCRCVSVMLLRSMQKYTKELADAKAENDALRDDVAAGRHRLYQSSLSVRRVKPPPPPAWIMQPPPTGRHRWTGLFHPQREADHYAKTTGRNPEVY